MAKCNYPVSIKAVNKEELFYSVYLNPAAEVVGISYLFPQGIEKGEILVLDSYGRKLKGFAIGANQKTLQVSCADLCSGIYFAALTVNGKIISSRKFAVVK